MANDLSQLAAAFNSAVDDAQRRSAEAATDTAAARRELDAQRATARERAEQQREKLLNTLSDFGETIGALRVERTAAGVVFGYRDRALSFDIVGDGASLAVVGGPTLADRVDLDVSGEWMATIAGSTRPLLPYGLQELLVTGLGLPRPPNGASDPGPPRIKRAPRIQTGIAPPRPPARRE